MKLSIYDFFSLFLPFITGFVWGLIPGGSYKVLRIGRSKNGFKKLKKTLTIKDKIFKYRYIHLSKGALVFQRYFIIMTYIGYICTFAIIVMFIISIHTNNFREMFYYFMLIKCYTIELPASVFTIWNIGRPENKVGLEWKFVEEYK